MDQDHAYNDDTHSNLDRLDGDFWRNRSDSETDELGLRIAAHAARRKAEDAASPDEQKENRPRSPPSPLGQDLREAGDRFNAQAAHGYRGSLEKQNEKPLRDRLERQPDSNKPREPFWRAKERHGDSIDTNKGGSMRPKQHVRAVSDGYPPVDLPVNVPQGWGHRNRHRATWLHRSTADGEGLGLLDSVERVDEDTVLLHKTSFTGDDILAAGGDTPLSLRRIRQFSSPSSLHHMNTTLQSGAPDVDDLNFDDASILVSTPAAKTRNRKIDELMKQEVADTARQGIATQRQGRFALGGARGDRPLSAPAGENKPFPRRRRSVKKKGDLAIDENEEELRALPSVTSIDDAPQANGRNESIELLRKLARVSSLSPSPAPDNVVRKYPGQRRKSNGAPEMTKEDTTDIPTVRQRGRGTKAPISSIFPGANTNPDNDQQSREPLTKLRDRDPRRINSEPLQPKSALEAIVQEAKSKLDPNIGDSTIASLEDIVNPNVDNSSVHVEGGRQARVDNTHEKGIALPASEEKRRREEREFEDANRRLRVARTSIKDADRGLRRLENQLESTENGPAIHPEHRKIDKPSSIGNMRIPDHLPGFTPYTDHNGRTKCRHCGGCYASVWRGMWVEFRELFYTWGPEETGSPLQLTWLGTMVAVWWAWIFSEILMSWLFNPWLYDARFPFVTITLLYRLASEPVESAKWLVDVVGNLIFGDSSTVAEPLASSMSTTSAWVRRAAPTPIRDRAAKVNDGDWVAAAAAATGAATRRVVHSAMEAVDEAGSMWDDDYLNLLLIGMIGSLVGVAFYTLAMVCW